MTDNQAIGVFGLGAGALALFWLLRRNTGATSNEPIATVTTYEGFDLSPYGGPTSYPEPIQRFAAAIAKQEGFYIAGSIPQRANNPGDLKIPGQPTLPGTSITKFDSVGQGWNALYKQLYLILTGQSAHYDLDMSIDEMARIWTATQQVPWATNVAAFLGVPRSTKLWQVLA